MAINHEDLIIESAELQRQRRDGLLRIAEAVADDLGASASQAGTGAVYAVDLDALDAAFDLYLSRLAEFKTSVLMKVDSRINDVKIAALTASCFLEKQALVDLDDAPADKPQTPLKNAYLTFVIAASLLDVATDVIPSETRTLLVYYLFDLDMVREGHPVRDIAVDAEPPFAFSRRLRFLVTIMTLIKDAYGRTP